MSDTKLPHNDATPVILTDEQKRKFKETISKTIAQLSFFAELMDTMDVSTVDTHMHLLEYAVKDLSDLTDYQSIVAQEVEQRHKELQQANQRIYELTNQLGHGITADAVCGALRRYENILRAWYEAAGWRYGSVQCNRNGFNVDMTDELEPLTKTKARFSSIDDMYQLFKRNLPQLQNIPGIQITNAPGSRRIHLLDTEENKQLIQNLVCGTFPDAIVQGFSSRNDCDRFYMQSQLYIPYKDLAALVDGILPQEQPATDE